MSSKSKPRVFITGSPADVVWRDRLVAQLEVLQDDLVVWHDGQLSAGDDRLATIQAELNAATVAVFLVSADSLASPLIREDRLQPLLERHEKGGLRIVPVLARPCSWESVPWLAKLELRPKGHALSAGREHEFETDLADIATEIAALLTIARRT